MILFIFFHVFSRRTPDPRTQVPDVSLLTSGVKWDKMGLQGDKWINVGITQQNWG